MEEIKKQIEEERNEAYHNASSCCPYDGDEYHAYRSGYDSGIDKGIELVLSKWQDSERWRKVEVHTLANNNLLRYALSNYLGVNPNKSKKELCELFAKSKGTLLIKNIFEEWKDYPKEKELHQERRAFDIGFAHLRLLLECKIDFDLEDSQAIKTDLKILQRMNPPLYNKITHWKPIH